jgi:hypothetical protein
MKFLLLKIMGSIELPSLELLHYQMVAWYDSIKGFFGSEDFKGCNNRKIIGLKHL